MDEHSYIRSIHRHLAHSVKAWKIHDDYQGGVADCYYDDHHDMLFAEYKYLKKIPKRDSTVIIPDCSTLQTEWLRERYLRKRPTVVILGTPLGGILFTHRSWEVGIARGTLPNYLLSPQELADIIYNHCAGISHVNSNAKTYSIITGSSEGTTLEDDLEPTKGGIKLHPTIRSKVA